MNFIVQSHGLSERLRPNHKPIEYLYFPTSHHHISNNLFVAVPFTQVHHVQLLRKKLHGMQKGTHPTPQDENMEQVSEQHMAGMLGLLYQEFKATITHVLRALMGELGSKKNNWQL